MILKILLAGSGGQGVLTMGNILGNAAMNDSYYVTYLPTYGAAVRGGTANCTVSISDEEIASPVASSPDFVVVLNKPSAQAFINRLESGGQMIYNSDLIDTMPYRGDIDLFPVPANTIAKKLGNEKAVNMVILGALVKLTNIVNKDTVYSGIEKSYEGKKKAAEISKLAFEYGYEGFPFNNRKD
jgi:2-oxoglutarate ferredoxin oxidoreductase subunit gamma